MPTAYMLDAWYCPTLFATRQPSARRWSRPTTTASSSTCPTGTAPDDREFRCVTTVTFDATARTDTVLDVAPDTVRRPALNGVEIDVSGYDQSTGIPLRGPVKGNVLVVGADCRYGNTGKGLHRVVDPVDEALPVFAIRDGRRQADVGALRPTGASHDRPRPGGRSEGQ